MKNEEGPELEPASLDTCCPSKHSKEHSRVAPVSKVLTPQLMSASKAEPTSASSDEKRNIGKRVIERGEYIHI